MDNTQAIVGASGTTPVLSYASKPVKMGALGGFAADDEKLGIKIPYYILEAATVID
jgi:putative tryptophan/tyrosine transport system substrate-binding protein